MYIVIFGGLALIRREGLSTQFALESLGVTAFVAIVTYLTNTSFHPVFFLILIYLITTRVRLMVDLGNFLSNRGRQRDAMKVHQFALRLYPDRTSELVVLVNMGIVQLRRKNPESASELFEMVLEKCEQGGLGIKYEAACRYNYGVALQQLGKEAQAVKQFNETTIIYPNSIYSKAADIALQKRRKGQGGKSEQTVNDT
ncbi:MAG: tetratricopeptide repeat protein [Chloroflexota bacterium]|nr:MAG: tetratricopeptide repeat protein [Chloroflexota bacterium]